MSYSFSVTAATKAAAIAAANAKLAEVVQRQPIHAHDMGNVAKIVDIVAGMVETRKKGERVYVSVSGSLGQRGDGPAESFNSASVNVSAYVMPKQD